MNAGSAAPTALVVVLAGVTVLLLLTAQLLIGYRKIHFKGRTHLKVHKVVAWVIAVVAVVHALSALTYLGVFRV